MKKYFKLAGMSISQNLFASIGIILQLTVMFVLVNVIIGSINSRAILSESYSGILDKQGWYLMYSDPEYSHNDMIDVRNKAIESLNEKPEILTVWNLDGLIGMDMSFPVRIVIVSDTYFEKLKLPVSQSVNSGDRVYMFPYKVKINAGDQCSVNYGEGLSLKCTFTVTDILSDPSYVPNYNSWNINQSVNDLYMKISGETEERSYVIMSRTKSEKLQIDERAMIGNFGAIAYYPDEIKPEEYDEMTKKLIEAKMSVSRLSGIKEKADSMYAEDLKKYTPTVIVIILIVMMGTAGSAAIQTLREMKKYAVYYLCGLKMRRMILVDVSKTVMLLSSSLLLCGAVLSVLNTNTFSSKFGMVFNYNNLYVTLLLAALTLFSSILLPFILLRKASPVDTMRRIKND